MYILACPDKFRCDCVRGVSLFMRACEGVRVGHACIYTYMYTHIHIYVKY